MTEKEAIRLDVRGRIAVLTIDRPEVRNAIDRNAAEAIGRAVDEVESRPEISALILTGGSGFFSAGMDLKAFAATGERPFDQKRGAFGFTVVPPEKPTIAAVEGACLGGGFELALACDLIVAAADAIFALPETTRGLTAAAGGLIRLPRRVPRGVAMEMVLTGAPLTAGRAQDLGLVNRVVEPEQTLPEALRLATRVCASAPLAVRASKRIIALSERLSETEAFAAQEPLITEVRQSDDAKEGARAFAEKRPAHWRGT